MRGWRHGMFCSVLLALGACTSAIKPMASAPATHVAYRVMADPGQPRYPDEADVSTSIPQPLDNPPPTYPAALVEPDRPVVLVKAKVIVDAEGAVAEVRIVPLPGRAPAFDQAVMAAVRQWHFLPLTFTRWEEVKDTQGNVVDSRPTSIEKKPFSLDYEFRFELRNGKPVVGSAAAGL